MPEDALAFLAVQGVVFAVEGPASYEQYGPSGPPPADAIFTPGTYPVDPIPPRTPCPPFEATGWVNGPPAALTGRVTVVDVWTEWCPVRRQTATGLTAAYQTDHSRGVSFVSLAPLPRTAVERYVTDFGVPWSCGYEVPAATVARLGAYSTDRFSAVYHSCP